MKCSFTVFGKKYSISGMYGLLAWMVLLSLTASYIWCLFGGFYRFGQNYFGSGVLGLVPLMLFCSITIDDKQFGVLPDNSIAQLFKNVLGFCSIYYYIFTITQ